MHEVLWLGRHTGYVVKTRAGSELLPAIRAVLRGEQFVGSGLSHFEFAEGADAQSPRRHEIFSWSDDEVLVDTFTLQL